MKNSAIYFITSLSVGVAVTYLSLGGLSRVNPRRYDWILGDNTTAYIAQLFYLEDKWRLPLTANPNYGHEFATNLMHTGPAVPLALIQKILRINPELQFFGFWFIIIFSLQVFLGLKIAREMKANWLIAVPFSILTITPYILAKSQMHFWLIPHFLILWAILIIIRYFKNYKLQTLHSVFLICTSYTLAPYIMVMVSFMLLYVVAIEYFHRKKLTSKVVLHLIYLASSLFALIWLFDGFSREPTLYESIKMNFPGPHYGRFGYNLLSFINPNLGLRVNFLGKDNPEYLSENFSISNLSLGSTPGSYEGYLYLGFGLIFLFIILFYMSYKKKIKLFQISDSVTRKITCLFVIVIIIYSVTQNIGIGSFQIKLPFPYLGEWALSPFRTSGRFMWVIGYAAIVFCFIKLYEISSKKSITIIIWVALLIQLVDLSKPMYLRFDALKQEKSTILYFNDNDINKFQNIANGHNFVTAYPPGHGSPNWIFLNYWAWKSNIVTNTNHTGRTNFNKLKRITLEIHKEICTGNLRREALYAISKENLASFEDCDLSSLNSQTIGDEIFYWSP